MAEFKTDSDLTTTLDSLSMGVVVVDAELKVELINNAFHKIWNTKLDEFKAGDDFRKLVDINRANGIYKVADEDWEGYIAERLAEIKVGDVKQREFDRADGKTLLYSVTNLSDDRRLISYFDVTKEKQREMALESVKSDAEVSRTQLEDAISALEDGFVFFDAEDKMVICNDAFRAQFKDVPGIDSIMQPGVTYFEMTLLLAKSGIIPGIEGKEVEFVENLIEKRKSELGIEKVFKTHDGRWIKQRDVRVASGGIVGVRIDVTELKKGEEELEKASTLLAASTKNMPQGMLVFNDNKIQFLNNRVLELFDVSADDAYLEIGKSLDEFLEGHVPKLGHAEPEEVKKRIRSRIENSEAYSVQHELPCGKIIAINGTPQENGSYLYTYFDVTDEKAAQKGLAEREELLNSILSASENGILVTNGFEEVVIYNTKALKLLGFTAEDIESLKCYRDLLESHYERKLYKNLTERDVELDVFLKEAMNVTREAIDKTRNLHMADGKIIRYRVRPLGNGLYVHSYIDITAEKKREKEIELARQKAEELAAIQSASSDAMVQGILFFQDRKLKYFNPKFIELVGVPIERISANMTMEELLAVVVDCGAYSSEEQRQSYLANMNQNFDEGTSYSLVREMKNGLILKVDGVARDNGGLVITYSDITESKQRELELEAAKAHAEQAMLEVANSKEMFEAFAKTNSDWFWRMDSELRFSYFSEPFQSVTGVDPAMLLGKTRRETGIPGVTQEQFDQHVDDLENKRSFRDFVHSRQKSDGTEIWLSISGNPVFGTGGTFEGYVGSGRDVTDSVRKQIELEKATKEAEAAERAKSEFLANMSHEIRTPMNGVMGMAELLATTELDSKQKMFTDVIVKSGASLLTIINDILDFSKIDAGQLELDLAPFDIQEAMEDVATLVSAKVAEKDLEMIVRVDPKLPRTLVGDVGRFRQVITNLLGNAVKFTETGHIYANLDVISTSNGVARFKCSVEDTGIGIPEDKCDAVFRKFSQADTSATRKHEGTGLGLSIASSLIELMGGQIQVESKVNVGSTFFFEIELPIDQTVQNRVHVIPEEIEGAKILIIDDNEVNRSILTEQMISWRFDSASASNGQSGLNIMRAVAAAKLNVDLVILDYQMPGMTGADVLEEMRSDPDLCNIPVIMLTSVDGVQTNARLAALTIEANLTKPTRSSMLLETIMQVIANNRAKIAYNKKPSKPVPMAEESPKTEKTAEVIAPQKAQPENTDQLDILVAEDNEVNQIVFRQILEELDVTFQIVENGRLAVAAYRANRPKMILMDVSMPEMNGKEATQAIRKFERQNAMGRVPIVGVTAHALKGDMEACIDAGMDDYLSKPVAPSKLIRKVEQWLRLRNSSASQSA